MKFHKQCLHHITKAWRLMCLSNETLTAFKMFTNIIIVIWWELTEFEHEVRVRLWNMRCRILEVAESTILRVYEEWKILPPTGDSIVAGYIC